MNTKNKKEERITATIIIVILSLIAIIFIGSVIRVGISEGIYYDGVCKYNYGKNYIYENDNDFGEYCIELIYENLTKENPKVFNWSTKEIRKMCDMPGFLELSRWDGGICRV